MYIVCVTVRKYIPIQPKLPILRIKDGGSCRSDLHIGLNLLSTEVNKSGVTCFLRSRMTPIQSIIPPNIQIIHHLLFIIRKPVSICIKHRSIKRRSMHVDGFHIELHKTGIQYRNLNMHKHTLASNCIQSKEIRRQ